MASRRVRPPAFFRKLARLDWCPLVVSSPTGCVQVVAREVDVGGPAHLGQAAVDVLGGGDAALGGAGAGLLVGVGQDGGGHEQHLAGARVAAGGAHAGMHVVAVVLHGRRCPSGGRRWCRHTARRWHAPWRSRRPARSPGAPAGTGPSSAGRGWRSSRRGGRWCGPSPGRSGCRFCGRRRWRPVPTNPTAWSPRRCTRRPCRSACRGPAAGPGRSSGPTGRSCRSPCSSRRARRRPGPSVPTMRAVR